MRKILLTLTLIAAATIGHASEQEAWEEIDYLKRRIKKLENAEKEYPKEELLSVTEQVAEGSAQSNPLMMGRPGLYEQYSEHVEMPVIKGISPEVAAAIPMPRPPRPIKYMPTEQQIILAAHTS